MEDLDTETTMRFMADSIALNSALANLYKTLIHGDWEAHIKLLEEMGDQSPVEGETEEGRQITMRMFQLAIKLRPQLQEFKDFMDSQGRPATKVA